MEGITLPIVDLTVNFTGPILPLTAPSGITLPIVDLTVKPSPEGTT